MQDKIPQRLYYTIVLLIPIINALASVTVNYFPRGTINPGTIRAGIIGIFILYFFIKTYPLDKTSLLILFTVLYWLTLSFFSSNINKTLYEFLKIFISVMMFPVGYYIINSKDRLRGLTRSFTFALLVLVGDVILANIFGYGRSDYLDASFYFGSGRVNITKAIIVLVLIAPIALKLETKRNRKIIAVIFILGLFTSLVGIKRSVLLSAMAGVLIYSFLTPNKAKILKTSFLLLVLSTTVLSFYIDIFLLRFDARGQRVEVTRETFETESRYGEALRVWDRWKEGTTKHKIFGSEFLNDTYFFKTNRMLHMDYSIVFNGSGLLGLFLWFAIFYSIIKSKNKYYQYLNNDSFYRELNAVFWMILITQLLLSISGTIYNITIRAHIFLFLGAIIGTMRNEFYSYWLTSKSTDAGNNS